MQEYLDDGLLYKFTCECGYEWHGVDIGDSQCEKCGSYGEALNTWKSAHPNNKDIAKT